MYEGSQPGRYMLAQHIGPCTWARARRAAIGMWLGMRLRQCRALPSTRATKGDQGQLTRPGCLGLPAERGRATGDPGCGLDRGLPCTAAQWAPNAHLPYVRRVPAPTHTHSLTLSTTLLLAPSASLLVAIEINHIAATSDRIHN
ncbi:hypothetical protein COCVIDRAFT_13833 [Bipolaris victoriae FI3]|uniref:Uncharacterized protein n=1 Tax=Bipolaris victoriae (strain FI3) TaxID=930091 RepID=W7ERE6_BIPV3|nr:hypothetical protein COCVIDRAFT_13833 [Bipolaris victoriae FI3]